MAQQKEQPTSIDNTNLPQIKTFLNSEGIKQKFNELLKGKAPGFISSLMQIISNNDALKNADTQSIYSAAVIAATLDLPINQNLGFAWIVPYKNQAQFQMGWKGYVQLALRTGQYKNINVIEVYKNQFTSFNALTEELVADFGQDGEGEVIGYCAFFKLITGMEKTVYWSKAKVEKHAKKYSKAYAKADGITPWRDKDQYDAMAKKTVLKNMISKWGIMSIELQTAVLSDQSVIQDPENLDFQYPDSTDEMDEDEKQALADYKSQKAQQETLDFMNKNKK